MQQYFVEVDDHVAPTQSFEERRSGSASALVPTPCHECMADRIELPPDFEHVDMDHLVQLISDYARS
jgi:hypothetical protein